MSQEQIFLYFKTAEFLKNKFVLDLLPTEVFHRKRLLYNFNELQLNNSRDYEHVSDEIKQLSKKVIYYQKKVHFFFKIDEENPNIKFYNFGQLKSKGKPMPYQKYPQNIEYYLYEYKFFDVKTNTIKDGEIFSPYLEFLHTGFHHKEGI